MFTIIKKLLLALLLTSASSYGASDACTPIEIHNRFTISSTWPQECPSLQNGYVWFVKEYSFNIDEDTIFHLDIEAPYARLSLYSVKNGKRTVISVESYYPKHISSSLSPGNMYLE